MAGLKTLQISNDGFAFDSSTGETYTLNCCGRLILQKMQQGENREQIITTLADQFGIAQSLVEKDLADFSQQIESFGISSKNSKTHNSQAQGAIA
jgi:hypothetical protein